MGGGYPCCCPGGYSGRSGGLFLPSGSGPPPSSGSGLLSGYGSLRRGLTCTCCRNDELPPGGFLLEVTGVGEEAFPVGRCLGLNRAWVCNLQECIQSCMLLSPPEFLGTSLGFDFWGWARVLVTCTTPGILVYDADLVQLTTIAGSPIGNRCGTLCGESAPSAAFFRTTIENDDCMAPSGTPMTPTGECLTCDVSGITAHLTSLAA